MRERLDRAERQPQDLVSHPPPQHFCIHDSLPPKRSPYKRRLSRPPLSLASFMRPRLCKPRATRLFSRNALIRGLYLRVSNYTVPRWLPKKRQLTYHNGSPKYFARPRRTSWARMSGIMTYCLKSIRKPVLRFRIISLGLRAKISTIWTGQLFVEKRLSPTKSSLKKDHESKLMDLVSSQSSTTEPDQDQEKQARIGLLGIEPISDSDPENEEDGTVLFLYPSHISDAKLKGLGRS